MTKVTNRSDQIKYVSSSSSRKLPIFSPEPNGWLNTHAKSKMEPQKQMLLHIQTPAIKTTAGSLHYQGLPLV